MYLRGLVIYLWAMDAVHLFFNARAEWVLIRHPGLYGQISLDLLWGGIFSSLVSLPVQVFFVLRIWKLSNFGGSLTWKVFNVGAVIALILCSIFQVVGYIIFVVLVIRGPKDYNGIVLIEKLPIAFWSAGAAEDLLISFMLLWVLWRDRIVDVLAGLRGANDAPAYWYSSSTERLMRRVTIVLINTGLWTSLCALATIIALRVAPNKPIYPGFFFSLGPLYCNTLLANLNGRGFVRGEEYSVVEPRSIILQNPFKAATRADIPIRPIGEIVPLGDMNTNVFEVQKDQVEATEGSSCDDAPLNV
ncbi:hypothetical protein C8Q76DRAFT_798386 [Earliella scabrosa]|nr:hypothetical protein C8Q76DRAFT_798386 [Earliella scabrosa]